MLSTRQAHHILQLSERHGAKVVFAGDTRQQQPVEAGPGLRLIRDVAGSVRVDRIRRQKADLEDVLVHVHKETPEQARFRAGLTNPQERDAIHGRVRGDGAQASVHAVAGGGLGGAQGRRGGAGHPGMASAQPPPSLLRRGEDHRQAGGRLGPACAGASPDTSTVVLARTRAETRALSWLMRQRVLAQTPRREACRNRSEPGPGRAPDGAVWRSPSATACVSGRRSGRSSYSTAPSSPSST